IELHSAITRFSSNHLAQGELVLRGRRALTSGEQQCILLELYEEAFAGFAAGSVDFSTNAGGFLSFLQVVQEVRSIFDQRLLNGGLDRVSDRRQLENILGRLEKYVNALPYGYWRISSCQPLLTLFERLAATAFAEGDLRKFLSLADASKCRELVRTI